MDHSKHARLTSAELVPDVLDGATIYGPGDEKIGSSPTCTGREPRAR